METKDVILELRNKAGLSQDELAEKVYVTRQAVSRWENGETTPNTETLKLLSKQFNVSINTIPKVENINALVGGFVNIVYTLPNGNTVIFLDDDATYLGNQLECEFGGDRCFGIIANMDFLLVCTYEENGSNPELVIYKKR